MLNEGTMMNGGMNGGMNGVMKRGTMMDDI